MIIDNQTTLVIATTVAELERHAEAIERLAGQSADPNPYYEPWFMLPLLRAFGARQNLRMLLIYAGASSELLGFLPFERSPFHRRLPLPCLRLWRDPEHWVLRSTPLIRQGALPACLGVLLTWLAEDPGGPRLVDLPEIPGNTAFAQALAARLTDAAGLRHMRLERESHLYRRQDSLDAYLAAILDGDRRRNLNRRARRLAEQGPLTYVDIDDSGEGERLVADFLTLEASGWKGGRGTAMASRGSGVDVAQAILDNARRRGRLSLLGMRVGNRLVAARSVLLSPPGGFGFKMAYDETEAIARCSPGYLLELEGLRRLHDDRSLLGAGMRWLDTCADTHAELARATRWEALPVQRTIIARRHSAAEMVVALLPRILDHIAGPGREGGHKDGRAAGLTG